MQAVAVLKHRSDSTVSSGIRRFEALCVLVAFFLVAAPQAAAATELSVSGILGTRAKTIEGVLASLSPKALARHLLVYGSESRQFASFLSPRVIVYSEDADFILAFNGEAGSKGFHELEILHFDHAASRFVPELIHFDPEGKSAPRLESDPAECRDCHQKDIRPNWEPYFHWPGLYGSEDDDFLSKPGDKLSQGPERTFYRRFLEKRKKQVEERTGRYRFLPELPAETRRNLDFNDRVSCLNMKRLLRLLTEHPLAGRVWSALKIEKYRFQLDREKISPELWKLAGKSYEFVKLDTDNRLRQATRRRLARHLLLTKSEPLGRALSMKQLLENGTASDKNADLSYNVPLTASLRFIFEELYQQDFRPLSTSRHHDYDLNVGAEEQLARLSAGATIDPKTDRVILRKIKPAPGSPKPSYGYECNW